MREGGSKSSKLSGAGGGRLFRDLDLLDEYMFSSSAYTADSLYGERETRVRPLALMMMSSKLIPVRMDFATYVGEVVGSLGKGSTIS